MIDRLRTRFRPTPSERLKQAAAARRQALAGGVKAREAWTFTLDTLTEVCAASPENRRASFVVQTAEQGLAALGDDREAVFSAAARMVDAATLPPALVDPSTLSLDPDSNRPVVVGPWSMEIGFEVLYWIPFLRRLFAERGIDPARVVAVSRGGVASWYADIAHRYEDVLDRWTPALFRERVEVATVGMEGRKPFGRTDLDNAVLTEIMGAPPGRGSYDYVLQGALYGAMRNVWRSRIAHAHVLERFPPRPITPPPAPAGLPAEYVAVKLYFSETFPDRPDLRAAAARAVEVLAEGCPVVLLSPPVKLDDHDAAPVAASDRVIDAAALMTPANNLGVQTAIIAGAKALVTVYGGFTYLGPLLGVPTVALTADLSRVNPVHLAAGDRLGEALDAPGIAQVPAREEFMGMLRGLV